MKGRRRLSVLIFTTTLLMGTAACTGKERPLPSVLTVCSVTTPTSWKSTITSATPLAVSALAMTSSGTAVGPLASDASLGRSSGNNSAPLLREPVPGAVAAQVATDGEDVAVVLEHRPEDMEQPRRWEVMLISPARQGGREVVVASQAGSRATTVLDGNLHLTRHAVYWVESSFDGHRLLRYDRASEQISTVHDGGRIMAISYRDEHVYWVEEVPGPPTTSVVKGQDLPTGKEVPVPRPLRGATQVQRLAMSGGTVIWTDRPGRLTVWQEGWDQARIVVDTDISTFFHQITTAGDFIIASQGTSPWFVDQRSWSATQSAAITMGRGFGHDLAALSLDPQMPEFTQHVVDTRRLQPLPSCPATPHPQGSKGTTVR